tara:strand:+ start:274 stop:390 length:117 start_codon:yes stop_codon:yes gene_type:complete
MTEEEIQEIQAMQQALLDMQSVDKMLDIFDSFIKNNEI